MAIRVVVDVAEDLGDHPQTSERVADLQLLGHAHAPMELYGFLADVPARIADLDFRR